ncbi:MAG: thioredoxin family protein [Saprospiraceae bacterium]|nr:thioredoxin family protein [Saprospiraceae bacterium]
MENISRAVLDAAMNYQTYRQLGEDLLTEKEIPFRENYSDSMLGYTELNNARMNRLDKTIEITQEAQEKLAQIEQPVIWLTLTEPWCGDAAQIVPALNKLAEANENIQLRFILRDMHLDIMDEFLTDGSRSIPKVIILDANTLDVLDAWGPRPSVLQSMLIPMIQEMKSYTDKDLRKQKYQAYQIEAQRWYNKDKTESIQNEILENTLQAVENKVQTIAKE